MTVLAQAVSYSYVVFIIFTILYVLTILGLIGVVISENRNPVKSLAWVTVLILLPVLGVFLFLLFGRSLKGVRMISRRKSNKLLGDMAIGKTDIDQLGINEESKHIARLVNSIVEPHYFSGNQIHTPAILHFCTRQDWPRDSRHSGAKGPGRRESAGHLRPHWLIPAQHVVLSQDAQGGR